MIRGIYTSASALRAATVHQTRLAHNLANLQTTGFKQILTTREAYQLQMMNRYNSDDNAYQEALGGLEQGLLVPEEFVDFSQGNLESTERPLDLAIENEGFFRVQTAGGIRYTRDGSLHRDGQGQLVTSDGHYVLGTDDAPIQLPAGIPNILRDGSIYVEGQQAGQISLATFADVGELVRENDNLYRGENAQLLAPDTAGVRQGFLEASNVDENAQVLEMMRILRLYEASQRSIQIQDSALSEAIMVGEV